MSLKTFFSMIAPSTERRRLVKTMEMMYDDIDKVIMPTLGIGDNVVNNSRTYQAVDRALASSMGPDGYRQDMVFRWLREKPVQTMVDEGPAIIKLIEKSFSDSIETEGLDYKRANLIQYVSGLVFFVEYISKLTFVVSAEASDNPMTKKKLLDEYREYITNSENLQTFVILTSIFDIKAKELGKALSKLEGISFDPRSHDAVMKVNKGIDPLKMNLIPGIGHLALIFGSIVNTLEHRKMEGLKERLTATKMQILYLQRLREGDLSEEEREALEKQIAYYQGQVAKIDTKIESMRNRGD